MPSSSRSRSWSTYSTPNVFGYLAPRGGAGIRVLRQWRSASPFGLLDVGERPAAWRAGQAKRSRTSARRRPWRRVLQVVACSSLPGPTRGEACRGAWCRSLSGAGKTSTFRGATRSPASCTIRSMSPRTQASPRIGRSHTTIPCRPAVEDLDEEFGAESSRRSFAHRLHVAFELGRHMLAHPPRLAGVV